MYEVRITQLIPYWDENHEYLESTGKEETYVVGQFDAEHMAKIFAEALDMDIAESVEYTNTIFTPRVTIWKVLKEIKEELLERK